jgi:hypothetical protein
MRRVQWSACVIVWSVMLSNACVSAFASEDRQDRAVSSDSDGFVFTRVSRGAPLYATYQSHQQLVVENRGGIFLTHLDSDPDPTQVPRTNSWRLLRSVDDGRAFTELFRATGHATAPAVETDEDDNVYVFAADAVDAQGDRGQLIIYRFSSSNGYRTPTVVRILLEKFVDKFTTIYDRSRQVFFVVSYLDVPLLTLDKAGRVIRTTRLFSNGPHALLEYPRLAMDGDALFLAWTTATPVKPWKYYSIHAMSSRDGAVHWTSLAGANLVLPVTSDDTGPLAPIARDSWLAGFHATHGYLHLMYLHGDVEIYCRIPANLDGCSTGSKSGWDADGVGINSLDGFFTRHADGTTLFAVGADYRHQTASGLVPIVAMRSEDHGRTWRVHAKSRALFHPYALGGARHVADGSDIVGIFTNVIGDSSSPSNEVYLLKVRTSAGRPSSSLPRAP